MKIHIAIIILFGCLTSIFSQDKEYLLQIIPTSSNLPDKRINAIEVDSFGFIWLGTSEGLYRYDGNHCKRIMSLPLTVRNATITALHLDHKSRLWIGTFRKGLIQYDLKTENTIIYSRDSPTENTLIKNRIKTIFEDDLHRIWIAIHTAGLHRLDETTNEFYTILPSDYFPLSNKRDINDIIHIEMDDNKQTAWIGTLGGLLKLNTHNDSLELFVCTQQNMAYPSQLNGFENIIRQFVVKRENLFIGTWGGGLCVFNKKTTQWRCSKFDNPLPGSQITNVVKVFPFPFDTNKVIVTKSRRGSYIFDITTEKEQAISDQSFIAAKGDNKDQLWLSTAFNDLAFIRDGDDSFQKISLPFKPSAVLDLKDKQQYIISEFLNNRVYRVDYKGYILKEYTFIPELNVNNNFIGSIVLDEKKKIVLRGSRGLYTFSNDEENIISYRTGRGSNKLIFPLLDICFDKDNNVWYSGKSVGLSVRNEQTNDTRQFTSQQGFTHDGWIKNLLCDKNNNIWYGAENGLGRYDIKNNVFTKYDRSKSIRDNNDIYSQGITGIVEDTLGNIWIGCSDGSIGQISNSSDTSIRIKLIIPPSIKGELYHKLIIGNHCNLWHMSSKSIVQYNACTHKIVEYSTNEGVVNPLDIFPGNNETILITKEDGLQIFNPKLIKTTKNPFQLILNGFYIFDQKIYTEYDLKKNKTIVLKYDQNYITVNTSLIGIAESDWINYEYKLNGLSDSWTKSITGKNMSWTNLPSGEYKLHIKAQINNLWIKSVPLKISIISPFWQTIWFRLMVFGIFIFIIYGFYRFKLKQAQEKAKHKVELSDMEMKTLRSQMNPHFIFNSLNSIKLFIIEEEISKAGKYITRFAKLLRTILINSKQQYVTLKEELNAMELYMDMEKMRFEDRFDFNINIHDMIDSDKVMVPPMILQPFIENAIWHGLMPKKEKGKLYINISKNNNQLECIIIDNGIGRKKAKHQSTKNHESLGLQITQDRLNILNEIYGMNASMEIIDLYDNTVAIGTKVIVILPYKINN